MECHHYLGVGAGPGPVLPSECLIFAVFRADARLGTRLIEKDFPTNRLKRGDLSLARHAHTSWATFRDYVIAPGRQSQHFQGIAVSRADALRSLIAEVTSSTSPALLRSICVLDKVEDGEHNGHAALKYCAEQAALSDKAKRVVRTQIESELTATFSEVCAVSSCYAEASQEGY
jgi:hypothetical protein